MLVKSALQGYASERIKKDQRKRAANEKYVGASEIGMCLRRISFAKRQKTSVESWGATERGKTFEDYYWLPAMKRLFGKNLVYAGKQQKTFLRGHLRATPDGLLINQPRGALKEYGVDDIGASREIVLDCKTIDPRINLGSPKPEHEFQIQVQMALMRLTTKHRPNFGILSYVNASFYDDVTEFVIAYDPLVFETAKARAAKALTLEPNTLPPEGWIAGGKECDFCPFVSECRQMRGDVPAAAASNIDHGFLDQVVGLAREERYWHTKSSGASDEQRKMQHSIKELLRAHGLNRVEHDGMVINWHPVKGRLAYDMPALRAAAVALGLDVGKFETVGEPTDRLVITERETNKTLAPARKSA